MDQLEIQRNYLSEHPEDDEVADLFAQEISDEDSSDALEDHGPVSFPHFRDKIEYKKQYMDLVWQAYRGGFTEARRLEELIAVRGDQWKEQDIVAAPGWSLKSMAVFVLLKHLPHVRQYLAPPPNLRWPGHQDGDLLARMAMLARRWRYLEPSEGLWQYLETLKFDLGSKMLEMWPEPDAGLAYYCEVVAQIIKNQFLFREHVKPMFKDDPGEIRADMERWAREEIDSHKKMITGQTPPELTRLYMSPVIRPGESDAHARTEGGVFAKNHRDILESHRPNICAEGLWEACGNFDTDGFNGILVFALLERISKQYCHFIWIANNVFLDTEIETDTMIRLAWRKHPYIIYMFGVYLIVNPERLAYFETRSPVLAIQTWFQEFWRSDDHKFFDGNRRYKLKDLPKSFPMNKP